MTKVEADHCSETLQKTLKATDHYSRDLGQLNN